MLSDLRGVNFTEADETITIFNYVFRHYKPPDRILYSVLDFSEKSRKVKVNLC